MLPTNTSLITPIKNPLTRNALNQEEHVFLNSLVVSNFQCFNFIHDTIPTAYVKEIY